MKNIKLTWQKKGLLISVVTFLVFNPLTGQYILEGINRAFQGFWLYGTYVCVAAGVYIGLYLLWTLRPEPINTKPKSKKTQKYIET